MKSSEIRKLFLEYFRGKGHEVLPSSQLLPADDPTLLFTNAGMVQFKSVFLGDEKRPYKRATTVQKCLRAGGKHNDLENVGMTARHHTFFEMLGNFSFGDYFKKEASAWAWDFLTNYAKLPAEKLQITVFERDDEAAEIWEKEVGVPSERIFRLGEKDNFWQMGDTGPCGPCSEILIDQGEALGCGRPDCMAGCDCDRYLEIWNLVFMQYNRDASGNMTPLPKPSIDTGMGLERLAAVLQGKTNNFDTDLFIPIINVVEQMSGKSYGSDDAVNVSMRVIADHMRSSAFVLSEGLTPSNEGRGYVLRRIIRRAARHGFMLGIEGPFLYKLLDPVYDMMSDVYPEILENTDMSRRVLQFEEERFAHTLSSGMEILDRIIKELKTSGEDTVPGSELFRLYDTFGFPLDLARDIADDNSLRLDEAGFQKEMDLQKARARASWAGAEDEAAGIYREILQDSGATVFKGYETLKSEAVVKAVIIDGLPAGEASEGDEVELVVDRTPFYGESGGQVGDTGLIKNESLLAEVYDTKKFHGLMLHKVKVKKGRIKQGDTVSLSVSAERRLAVRRNHTATHLLHAALKETLGDHIKQAGSLVAPDRLRFDFTHFFALSEREKGQIERLVNKKILGNMPVVTAETGLEDAISQGVVALFGEKYGERVRVVRAGDFSAELCGGTHCEATGEIGLFHIISEGSVAAGIRRIEALTGLSAFDHQRAIDEELKKASGILRVSELKVSERIEKLMQELKQRERELEGIRQKAVAGSVDGILKDAADVGGIRVIAYRSNGMDMKALRGLADSLKQKLDSGIIVLASSINGQAYYVSAVTKDLSGRYHAGDILKAVTGGKGGGRPDMAQGGTKDPDGIADALSRVSDIIQNKG